MKVWFKSLVLILILNLISLFVYADTYPERDYPEGSFPKYNKVAYHFTPGYQQEKRQWFKAIKLIYENQTGRVVSEPIVLVGEDFNVYLHEDMRKDYYIPKKDITNNGSILVLTAWYETRSKYRGETEPSLIGSIPNIKYIEINGSAFRSSFLEQLKVNIEYQADWWESYLGLKNMNRQAYLEILMPNADDRTYGNFIINSNLSLSPVHISPSRVDGSGIMSYLSEFNSPPWYFSSYAGTNFGFLYQESYHSNDYFDEIKVLNERENKHYTIHIDNSSGSVRNLNDLIKKISLSYIKVLPKKISSSSDAMEIVAGKMTVLDMSKLDFEGIGQLPQLRQNIDQLRRDITRLNQNISNKDLTISQLNNQIRNKTEELNSINTKVNEILTLANQKRPENTDEITLDTLKDRLIPMFDDFDELKANWELIKEKYKELGYGDLNNIQDLLDKLNSNKTELDLYTNKINNIIKKLNKYKNPNETINTNNLLDNLQNVLSNFDSLKSDWNLIKEKYNELGFGELNNVQELLRKLSELKSQSNTLNNIKETIKALGYDENSNINSLLSDLQTKSDRLKYIEDFLRGENWVGNTVEEIIENLNNNCKEILSTFNVNSHQQMILKANELLEIEKKYNKLKETLNTDNPQEKVEELLKDKESLISNKKKLENEKRNLEIERHNLKENNSKLELRKTDLIKSNESYSLTLNVLGNQIKEYESKIKDLNLNIDSLNKEITLLKNELKNKSSIKQSDLFKIVSKLGDNLDKEITRREIAEILSDLSNLLNIPKTRTFNQNFVDSNNFNINLFEKGITHGVNPNLFSNETKLDRKMFGAFLLRVIGVTNFEYEKAIETSIKYGIFKPEEVSINLDRKEVFEAILRVINKIQ